MKIHNCLYVFMILCLFTCSDVSWYGTPPNSDKTYFNPPTWIQGTWLGGGKTIKFTSNDFIIGNVSYNERINLLGTKYLSSNEQTTSTTYKITIRHLSVNIDIYSFEFVSTSEIKCRYESGTEEDWDNRTIEEYVLTRA